MSPEEKTALSVKLRGGVEQRSKGISVDRSTRVLAIASGKGGVGKSSLTVNLAAAFARLGHQTGVLDADIYGHSIPHMLGVTQRPIVVDKMIVPPVKDDLKLMSIGFFLEDNSPVMWRGPMLHRALEQFLSDVHWGELDMLLVDMPPGTGDVSISLGQLLPRAEAVIVTTPQPLAQEVAARAAIMAQKTNMRLIGVIENMTSEVFGTGGGERLAEQIGVPLLGKVPLDARLRECGDDGEPLVWAEPESETAQTIVQIAEAIHAGAADVQGAARPLLSDPRERLRALGFSEADAATLADHFLDAERRGKTSHGLSRVDWLREACPASTRRRGPSGSRPSPGYERWDGSGAVGYLTLAAICDAQLADPPAHARVVVASRCFPTGMLGYWVRRLADGGLVAALTATSPARLASPDGGPPLAGTNPIAIGVPSSDGRPLVADVSMGRVTHGDVLTGDAAPEELVPFGGDRAHKAFALAVGVQMLVGALAGEEPGAVLVVARPEFDPVPGLRALAGDLRLPGDS